MEHLCDGTQHNPTRKTIYGPGVQVRHCGYIVTVDILNIVYRYAFVALKVDAGTDVESQCGATAERLTLGLQVRIIGA